MNNQAMTIALETAGHACRERKLHPVLEPRMHRLKKDGKVRATMVRSADGEDAITCSLSLQGLLYARCVELPMAGASDAEIKSRLEHAIDPNDEIYRRQGKRSRRADVDQGRVGVVVSIRAERVARHAANGE